jgi:hypothetical protein
MGASKNCPFHFLINKKKEILPGKRPQGKIKKGFRSFFNIFKKTGKNSF